MSSKIFFKSLIFFSFIALSFAYFVEFILGHEPCNLCKIERIPYIGSIILGSLFLFINKWEKIILIFILLLFVFGSIISIYHVGIENGILSETFLCDLGINNNILNPDELLKTLEKAPISCKDVTFKIFGLSLATFNTVLSIVISYILLKLILKK
ncbi:disulfide bond formation protein B [Pelagibacteraceae bacterium]|nr:disulfide bond formation protein B [Pelagibacteraceae bacterium]